MSRSTRPRKFVVSIIGAVIVSSTIIATPASSNEIEVRQGAREAAVVLEELPVKGRAPKTGYSRSPDATRSFAPRASGSSNGDP